MFTCMCRKTKKNVCYKKKYLEMLLEGCQQIGDSGSFWGSSGEGEVRMMVGSRVKGSYSTFAAYAFVLFASFTKRTYLYIVHLTNIKDKIFKKKVCRSIVL